MRLGAWSWRGALWRLEKTGEGVATSPVIRVEQMATQMVPITACHIRVTSRSEGLSPYTHFQFLPHSFLYPMGSIMVPEKSSVAIATSTRWQIRIWPLPLWRAPPKPSFQYCLFGLWPTRPQTAGWKRRNCLIWNIVYHPGKYVEVFGEVGNYLHIL